MLAADDGKPGTMAAIHQVKLLWDDPHDAPDAGKKVYNSMYPIVEATYPARGGTSPHLQGPPGLIMGGRADVRLSIDASGELYLACHHHSEPANARTVSADRRPRVAHRSPLPRPIPAALRRIDVANRRPSQSGARNPDRPDECERAPTAAVADGTAGF